MTDKKILAEFRARLAERNKLQPPMASAKVDDKPRTNTDWLRVNLSAASADIYIFDDIGMFGTTAQGFVDQLNAISAPKINIYLNSYGGEVFDGIAIHTALAMSKAHVTTFVTGVAASAASFIAMAGDTIKMARNATMMIHDASGLAWGNAATMRQEADLLDKLSDNIADMYAMQAGGEKAEWRKAMLAETWYTGQEALAAGLVDEIADGGDADSEPVPANRLSLALFNYAGRADAPPPEMNPTAPEEVFSDVTQRGDDEHPSGGDVSQEESPLHDEDETLLARDDHARTMLALLAERMKSHSPQKGASA